MVEYNEGKNLNIVSPEIRQPGEISTSGVGPTVTTPVHFDATVILTTKRLTLRPPAERDLHTVAKLANNLRVAQNLGTMPHPYTANDALHWIETLSKPATRQRSFAITDRYSDNFIGGCGYRPFEDQSDAVAIGYWLGEEYWGQGLAAEAAQAMIDYAFDREDIHAIWVTVRAANNQSKRVIEKCGFQFTYSGMANSLAVHGMVAIDYYSMTRRTWDSLHAWGER